MRKKNQLYKVNKWNKQAPLFAEGIDRTNQNIFDGYSSSYLNAGKYADNYSPSVSFRETTPNLGIDYTSQTSGNIFSPPTSNWKTGLNTPLALNFDIDYSKAFSNPNTTSLGKKSILKGLEEGSLPLKDVIGNKSNTSSNTTADAEKGTKESGTGQKASGNKGASTAYSIVSSIPDTEISFGKNTWHNGVWDMADPFYNAGFGKFGHRENKVGNFLGSLGVTATKTGAAMGNPYVMAGGAIIKLAGDAANIGWGYAYNQANLDRLQANVTQGRKAGAALMQASNIDDYFKASGLMTGSSGLKPEDIVEGGAFVKGNAREKGRAFVGLEDAALKYQANAAARGARQVDAIGDSVIRRNFIYDEGGLLNNRDMGAIDYNFMQDYLLTKKKQQDNENQMNNIFSGMPSSMFAIGGDLQTNGADFTSGLTRVDAGGSHETSPYDGVQMGVDSEGTPNLVEEGETIFDDYVFSNRILADESTKKLFHLPKKKDITFADISKKLEKEISERPNDPISRAGFKAQMEQLEEQQERQKQEMEATRARAAFEALTPEEQTALMQQVAQQEAATEQQAIEAQQAQEQAATQQPSPEEMAMAEGQQEIPAEELLAQQQAQVAALGGRLVKAGDVTKEDTNMFATGGRKARKAAKRYNKDWFLAQAKSLGMTDADLEGWEYNPNDPEANLSTFNNRFRDFQKKRALETYRTGQKKSKENELFGDKRLYRYSDDKSKIFKTRINDTDRIGWINADYTGALDDKGNLKGFISQEDYNKLSDKDKEAYKRINERAGDKMYDFRGKAIEDLYNGSIDDILGTYNYDEGFKWNDKDAQTLQYPVDMEKSDLSYLRYAPAFGGAFGLAYDMLNPADYSRAEGIQRAGQIIPRMVKSNFNPTYMTYRPLDIWYGQNALNAQSRATDRALLNNSSPSRMAGLLANGYYSQLASGNLFRQAQEYNDALNKQVVTHNSGENKTAAQLDMQGQLANQRAAMEAGIHDSRYKTLGYHMMDDIDARRNASMNANLTNVLQSIGNIGEEAYDEDRLRWLERTGVLRSNMYDTGKYTAKNGGKLKRKRGLTF